MIYDLFWVSCQLQKSYDFYITTCFGLYRPSSGGIYTVVLEAVTSTTYLFLGYTVHYFKLCYVIHYNLKFDVKIADNVLIAIRPVEAETCRDVKRTLGK
jgi:hypothetical protein